MGKGKACPAVAAPAEEGKAGHSRGQEQSGLDPALRLWPISMRCLFRGCFYPEGARCCFCLQPRRSYPLVGISPLEALRKKASRIKGL